MYDVKKIREQFPMLDGNKKMQGHPLIYLDNASTTFKPMCVIEEINRYYKECTANSHRGDYDLLYNMDMEVAFARETIAKFINCDCKEVIFTSGDTMSINLIAWGYGRKFLNKGDEILISESEHASNAIPWFEVAKYFGAKVNFIPLNEQGEITAENLSKSFTPKTKIVALAQSGNVLGYTIDIKKFAKICHENGSIFVVDGAQSVPHMKVDFKDSDIDFLAFSAHKMCGPTGVGALIGKYSLLKEMNSFIVGGGMNEIFKKTGVVIPLDPPYKFEAGTLPLAEIIGFKAAVNFLLSLGMDNIHNHDIELIEYAISKLKDNPNIEIYNKYSHSGILCFNVKGVFAQDEATLLNSKGIAIRSGEHCAKMLDGYLHTKATCRMSTYLYTNKEDIDTFVDALNSKGDFLDAYFSN